MSAVVRIRPKGTCEKNEYNITIVVNIRVYVIRRSCKKAAKTVYVYAWAVLKSPIV